MGVWWIGHQFWHCSSATIFPRGHSSYCRKKKIPWDQKALSKVRGGSEDQYKGCTLTWVFVLIWFILYTPGLAAAAFARPNGCNFICVLDMRGSGAAWNLAALPQFLSIFLRLPQHLLKSLIMRADLMWISLQGRVNNLPCCRGF